jgi:hypothetical protein
MRKFVLFVVCFLSVVLASPAAPLYVFSADGLVPGSAPRVLPTQGRSRTTGEVVVGLGLVSASTRADCGWYEFVADTNTAPVGYVVASNVVTIGGVYAAQHLYFIPRPFTSWEISKYKLCLSLAALGKLDAFQNLIAADTQRQFLWDACQTLDRTNALVIAIEAAAPATFGVDAATVSNLLWEARANAR